MSSFDKYYEEWKKKNNINKEVAYNPNATFEEKKQGAINANDMLVKRHKKEETKKNTVLPIISSVIKSNISKNENKNTQKTIKPNDIAKLPFEQRNQEIRKMRALGLIEGPPIATRDIRDATNINNLAYVAKSTGVGAINGAAGLAQAALTDVADNMKKGEKENVTSNVLNVVTGGTKGFNPINIYKNIKENVDMLKDKDKTLIEKAVGLPLNIVSQAKEIVPGYSQQASIMKVAGKMNPNAYKTALEMNDLISKPINKMNQNLQKESQNYNGATNFLANAGKTIGNMAPSIAATMATGNPTIGLGVMGASAKGQATNEALNQGQDIDEAVKIGDAKALVEVATEKLSGGLGVFGKGNLDDIAEEFIKKGAKSEFGKFLLKQGYNVAEEFIKKGAKSEFGKFLLKQGYNVAGEITEEEISNLMDNFIDKGTVDPNKKIVDLKEGLETAGQTAFTTLVLNGLTGGYQADYREAKANTQEQQIIPQQNRITQNEMSEQIIPPVRSDQYIETKNKEIDDFNGYTQKEINNIQSKNIKIAKNNDDIINFVRNSKKVPSNAKLYIAKISNNVSTAIKNKLGINVDNYNISMTSSFVNHALKRHGNNILESSRGQVAITESDFGNITEIINNPDNIKDAGLNNDKKQVIQFEKNINGNNIVVSYVSDKHHNLELQTMYKFRNDKKINPVTVTNELNSLARTFKTNSDMDYINNSIPQNKNSVKSDTINNYSMQNMQNNTNGEQINWNEIERPEGKFRKHYRSIIESNNTTAEAKKIAKEVMGQDTYIPDSNTKQLERADERISMSGADTELNSMLSKAINNEKITAVDVAVGERLIEYYSKTGDAQKLQDAIQTTAMIGTELGQAVQAMNILNHQTPQGQLVWIQRSIDKMNNTLKQTRGANAPQFNLTEDMMQKILQSENQQQMNENLDIVYKELGQQVHKSTIEQLDSWRYFAMLGNPRTHIRNMTGNFLMGIAQDTKNKVAGIIEGAVSKVVPEMERTQTLKMPSEEVIEFAKNDIQNVISQLEGDNKYNPKSALERNMRTFKSDTFENTLGKMFDIDDSLLETEDALGLKAGYKKALAQYITANNLDINNITDKQLAKARNYAIKQAQERTFHQVNAIASAINSFTRKNKVTKAIGDAILPFVKTPLNVAKTGIEYSPAGLAKTIVYDTVQLRKGNININQYIDNLSKGLTGSAITVLGYALSQAGILKAGGSDDDKKEKFDQQSGKQAYAIQVGEKTYSIDWLAPVGIPLMVGAEIYEGLTQKSDEKTTKATDDEEALNKFLDRAEVLTNSLTSTLDPMVEMSMISGLVSSLKSFSQSSTEGISAMATNAAKSYINQYVPTLLGQIAKTTDTVERDTTSTKSGTLSKAIDGTINQVKSKIPGLRQTLPIKTDIWGEEQKLNDNWAMRFFKAGILPMNIKNVKNNMVINELNDLYDKTGESSILPTNINKKITIDGQEYRLTNEEYNKYKTMYGKNSYKLINDLVKSKNYKRMSNEEKKSAIEDIYSYVKEQNKIDYSKNNNIDYEESTLSKVVNKLGNDASNYFEYNALTKGINKEKEKIEILEKSSYSDNAKKIIYENSIGKDDAVYSVMKKDNININEYLKYKQQDFTSDKKDDGTIDGKTVSNSKKSKVEAYLNSMKITGNQIILLYAINGYATSNSQKTQLAHYVNDLKMSKDEKLKLYNKFSGFTVYKDGRVTW